MTDVIIDEERLAAATPGVVRLDDLDEQLIGELVDRARCQGLRLTGEGGLLRELTKAVIESMAEGEMDDHLGYAKHHPAGRDGGNSRNGARTKTVLTDIGEVEVAMPRDRDGSFQPQVVGKRQRRLSGIDGLVISLSAKGLTHGEIAAHLAEVYGAQVSKQTISTITDRWIDSYTAGIRADLEFPGFAEEVDYQRYIDTVSLPAFMLVAGPVPRLVPDQCFTSSARLVVDGMQRTDLLTDLFEDLRDGRLALPVCDLERYGATRADLRDGLDTPAVRALISATASSARASLVEGERILGEIAPDCRPFFRFLIGLFHERLDDVGTRGAAVIRRPYHDGPVACLRLMARSRRVGASTTAPST